MLWRFWRALREPVNGLSHMGAAVAALAGLVGLLIVGRSSVGKQVSLLIYGCTLVLLFSASATYHSIRAKPAVVSVLRKLDHAAIFLLIAGSYTPFCYNLFSGFWKWGLLAVVWSMAIAGVILKVFYMRAPRWLSIAMYLLLGWLAVAGIREMLLKLPIGALIWLGTGGLLYTVGALVYGTKILDFVPNKFGFHEIWHIFVILGAAAHFVAIAAYVAPTI